MSRSDRFEGDNKQRHKIIERRAREERKDERESERKKEKKSNMFPSLFLILNYVSCVVLLLSPRQIAIFILFD